MRTRIAARSAALSGAPVDERDVHPVHGTAADRNVPVPSGVVKVFVMSVPDEVRDTAQGSEPEQG